MRAIFIDKHHEAGNAWTFRFKPEEEVTWVAGQYQRWELPVEAEKHDKEHWFTISSAPYEGVFAVTTRLSGSAFKNALDALKPGDAITVDTLEGDFVWAEDDMPKVYVAGGIGITPLHSMLKQRAHDGLPLDIHVLYANRDEGFVFRGEFEALEREHPELTVSYAVGNLTAEVILNDIPDLTGKLVYLSGPEAMVETLGAELKKHGLPEAQLKQDWFPGYDETSF